MTKFEITDYQYSKLAELRKALGNEILLSAPIYNDEFSLLRWLIGHDYKISKPKMF